MRVGRKVKHEEACDRVPLVEGVQSLLTTQMKTRNALGPSRAHPTDFLKQFSFFVSLKQHLYMEEDAVENKPLSLESSLTRFLPWVAANIPRFWCVFQRYSVRV